MSKLSLIYPRSNPELHILRLSSKLAYIYLQKTKHHKLLAPISRNQTTSSVHSEDMIYNHRSIYRKSFILIIVIQKYLTIKSPHVPNGKPRDRVGVGGGGLHPMSRILDNRVRRTSPYFHVFLHMLLKWKRITKG